MKHIHVLVLGYGFLAMGFGYWSGRREAADYWKPRSLQHFVSEWHGDALMFVTTPDELATCTRSELSCFDMEGTDTEHLVTSSQGHRVRVPGEPLMGRRYTAERQYDGERQENHPR